MSIHYEDHTVLELCSPNRHDTIADKKLGYIMIIALY